MFYLNNNNNKLQLVIFKLKLDTLLVYLKYF